MTATPSAPKRSANEPSRMMLTGAAGRAFRQSTAALMTCLCSALPGALPGRLQGQGLDHQKVPSRTHVAVGADCRLGSDSLLMGLSTQGWFGWVLRPSTLRDSGRLQHQHGLVLEVTQHPFLHILLTDAGPAQVRVEKR